MAALHRARQRAVVHPVEIGENPVLVLQHCLDSSVVPALAARSDMPPPAPRRKPPERRGRSECALLASRPELRPEPTARPARAASARRSPAPAIRPCRASACPRRGSGHRSPQQTSALLAAPRELGRAAGGQGLRLLDPVVAVDPAARTSASSSTPRHRRAPSGDLRESGDPCRAGSFPASADALDLLQIVAAVCRRAAGLAAGFAAAAGLAAGFGSVAGRARVGARCRLGGAAAAGARRGRGLCRGGFRLGRGFRCGELAAGRFDPRRGGGWRAASGRAWRSRVRRSRISQRPSARRAWRRPWPRRVSARPAPAPRAAGWRGPTPRRRRPLPARSPGQQRARHRWPCPIAEPAVGRLAGAVTGDLAGRGTPRAAAPPAAPPAGQDQAPQKL